tara:strand:- start:3394 stop:4269 length:876 start_codon:yes stop_codon:yes gene_type:complete
MGLAKISPFSADALRDIIDPPPPPGLSPVHTTDEPGRRFPVIMGKVKTPLVTNDSVGGSKNSAAGQFNVATNTGVHPIEDDESREPVTGMTASTFTCAGDKTSGAVAGTRIVIDGSTDNDGLYELSIDPTYAAAGDTTTFTVTRTIPGRIADGVICLPVGWIPAGTEIVNTATAHSPVAAFAGDFVAFAQINGEFVPIAGPSKIVGYLTEIMYPPSIDSNELTANSAELRVMHFDESGAWVDSGVRRTVENVWEGVTVAEGTMVNAEFISGRWMVTAVGCQSTALTFPVDP